MADAPIRLAELLLGLTGVADLGMGQPVGAAARTCHAAVGIARVLGCDEQTTSDVFYAALLQHVGCTAYSHEASLLFGNELSIKRASLRTDFERPREVLLDYLPTIMREAPPGDRLRTAANALLRSGGLVAGYTAANCEVAAGVARRLELSAGVQGGLLDIFEWWNGKGLPKRLREDDISLVARIVNVAGCAALFNRLGGPTVGILAVRQRVGRQLDPQVASAFASIAPALLAELATSTSETVLDLEPRPIRIDDGPVLDNVLRTFGEAVDLKAPFLHGHSTGVAQLVKAGAACLRFGEVDTANAVRASYVHDLGRAAIPSAIWESPHDLSRDAWSQIQLHAYYSQQILQRSPPLAQVATLASLHHERLNGSGYHRELTTRQLPMPARLLAAADVYQALISPRPHRQALSPQRAAGELRAMSRAGQLDSDAVAGVLADADGARQARIQTSHRLTERQVEVLRLIAEGLSNKAIGDRLRISPRTAERHVQDVYLRIGVSSRAAAAMYAMEHGLL